MSKQKKTRVSRRDFLSTASAFGAGAALGLSPMIALGKNNPLQIAPEGAKISKLAIYPSIGVCRIGNSEEYFLAPEIPGLAPKPEGGFKDGLNKIKKQAQRFRIYAFDDQGRVVREITQGEDEITWSVQVANTKAAWYEFNNPLDMGSYAPGLSGKLRNNSILGEQREMLEICSHEISISGTNKNEEGAAQRYRLMGEFWQTPNFDVKLGDVRTDDAGRLIVVPADGAGRSVNPEIGIDNFSDNDGWHDDWADGYVKASVKLAGADMELDVEPAWVACCGPDFAPEIPPFMTLYDVVRDVMVNGKENPLAQKPAFPLSFREEIYPFFHRLGLMAWVAAAANLREGWVEIGDFLDPAYMAKLADSTPENAAFRAQVFEQFRDPSEYKFYDNAADFDENIRYKIPYMLGSGVNYDFSPAHWFIMPKLQYEILAAWKDGKFVDDLDEKTKADNTQNFEDIPLDQQPMALIRAALEPLSGGAFHPGVELTWPMRQQAIYRDDMPFRIKVDEKPEPVYKQTEQLGMLLTPQAVFGDLKYNERSGESYSYIGKFPDASPIGAQKPGDLTRWLGLPWHPDAFSCQQVLYSNDFPNAAWWPALLPIDVMTAVDYKQLSRPDLDDETKLKFFNNRQSWSRGVAGIGYHVQGSYSDGLARMVSLWHRMGFVLKHERPSGLSERLKQIIPEELFVETERGSMDLYSDDSVPNTGLPKDE